MKDFRKKINEFEYGYEPGAWGEMELLLDKSSPKENRPKAALFYKIATPIILICIAFAIFYGKLYQRTDPSIAANSDSLIERENIKNNNSDIENLLVPIINSKGKINNIKTEPTPFKNTSNPIVSKNKKIKKINTIFPSKAISPISQNTNKQNLSNNNSEEIKSNTSKNIIKSILAKKNEQYNLTKTMTISPLAHLEKISTLNIIPPLNHNKTSIIIKDVPELKLPEKRLPIILNLTTAVAFRKEDTGIRMKIDAIFPVNKKWGVGLSFAQSWYETMRFNNQFEDTKSNRNASELYAMSRFRIFENNKHKTSLKAGIGYQYNYFRIRTRINSTEGVYTQKKVVIKDHFGADIGIDYQYFFRPHFSAGIHFGYAYGSRDAFYVGAMAGYRFNSFKIKDLKTHVKFY